MASRMRSSRSPCSPVAASVHLPGVPGGDSRTNSERPLAPRASPAHQYRPCFLPVRQVLAAHGFGALRQQRGDGRGVHRHSGSIGIAGVPARLDLSAAFRRKAGVSPQACGTWPRPVWRAM